MYPAGTKAAKGSAERSAEPGVNARPPEYKVYNGTRNARDVLNIATAPCKEAHFATWPPKLARWMILAGSSPKVCERCGGPWTRETAKTGHVNKREPAHQPGNNDTKTDSTGWKPRNAVTGRWLPSCSCEGAIGSGKAIVLDPFGGSGTTGAVAIRHGRDGVVIEASAEYCVLARKRIAKSRRQPGLPGMNL